MIRRGDWSGELSSCTLCKGIGRPRNIESNAEALLRVVKIPILHIKLLLIAFAQTRCRMFGFSRALGC
jgi:hypothetical protein